MGVSCENLVFARGDFQLSANWSLPSGASLALIGPSGAGKSLFLGGLAGFDHHIQGRLELDGLPMAGVAPESRPVTLMFQDHNLFPHLTAFENVGLGLDPGLRLDAEAKAHVLQTLRDVELEGLENRTPSQMSGGQQSRVALARALIRNRSLLLLDEPFSALGPGLRRDMLDLVEVIRRKSNATLIFVTHAPEEAKRADFTAFVADGEVAAPLETETLFADPPATLKEYL